MTQDPFHASPIRTLNLSSLGFLFFLFGFSYEQYVCLALKHLELVIPKVWVKKNAFPLPCPRGSSMEQLQTQPLTYQNDVLLYDTERGTVTSV